MAYSAATDIGDNLHILVRVGVKARASLNGVIIYYAQITKTRAFGVVVVAKIKMVDLNAVTLDQAKRIIAGSARSMGVEVVD